MFPKLILRNPLAHGTRGTDTPLHHPQQLIHIIGSTPLLMRHDLDPLTHLRFLDRLAIGAHAALSVVLAERVGDQRRAVQAGQGDELPAVAQRG